MTEGDFMRDALNRPTTLLPVRKLPCEFCGGDGCYLLGNKEDLGAVQCGRGGPAGEDRRGYWLDKPCNCRYSRSNVLSLSKVRVDNFARHRVDH